MKHSDINHSENTFGIHLINKGLSITNHQMSVNSSNSSAVMIGPVISTSLHPNSSTILNTSLNTPRSNLALLSKPNSMPSPSISSNMISQLTYLSPTTNAIKLVSLSKCQQLQNINKDSQNAINVQFVTPILNNTGNSLNDSSKIDNSSITLTSSSNHTMTTSNSSITCTRFILHSSQAPMLPHGSVTIIPQPSECPTGTVVNSQLIKNTRYALTGTKSTPQAIRPITVCSSSAIIQPGTTKQSISKVSPPKSLNNYTINKTENINAIPMQDLSANRNLSLSKDQQRVVSKSTPIKPTSYTITSNNNIRLALTSNITNSKVNVNPSRIQLISPKSRKRSGSPINILNDGKLKDPTIETKVETVDNLTCFNLQSCSYSPARKRARKQHLKSVSSKLQKLGPNDKADTCILINNMRHPLSEKSISTPISIAPVSAKLASISTQNKVDDNALSSLTSTNPQLIIPLKNPIHIGPSKSSTLAPIYTNQLNSNNGISNSTNPGMANFNQVQIITQGSHSRAMQLSSINHNLILSPKYCKTLTTFSPQKVIHIAPSKIANSHTATLQNERIPADVLSSTKDVIEQSTHVDEKEAIKIEVTEIKSEPSEEQGIKYSLFSHKYHWNARRSHFEKECDVKIKRTKAHTSLKQSEDNIFQRDIEISDTRFLLCKTRTQFLMQKCFDEENLDVFRKLKEKFDIKAPLNDGDDEPIFTKICLNEQQHVQLPDQIDQRSFSEFTDPRLFGISEDITEHHINVLTPDDVSLAPQETRTELCAHQCSADCLLYSSELPATTQPPQILRIIDLIEGLIVKERKIIEKESEINDQCLRLLHSPDCHPLSFYKKDNQLDRKRVLNGQCW